MNSKDLHFIKDLVQSGNIKPIIDKTYPLNEIKDAFHYLGSKRASGKIVIEIN